MSNFLNIKLASNDPVVQAAQSSQLARESQWMRKSSAAVQCQEIFQSLNEECLFPQLRTNMC